MPASLDKLTIKGFKSIKDLENFELTNLNVLIGGNGAGKSNFIDFFRLLRAMMELSLPGIEKASLASYIEDGGGSDDFLYNGPKVTRQIDAELHFGLNGYKFTLTPSTEETFIINGESTLYTGGSSKWWSLGSGHIKPVLLSEKNVKGLHGGKNISFHIHESIASWKIYHFHDSSKTAPMRRSESVYDHAYLRFDGSNIAPFLLHLKETDQSSYFEIIESIRLVTPFFDDFILKPNKTEKVRLLWNQKGSDYPLKPNHLSDGTIRFICLAAALLQPQLPSTIILDEPELGLHPFAIEILAELIKTTSEKTQVIVSTQSPALVDCFDVENIIVVNRKNGFSHFERLSESDFTEWLKDYSLGDLWRKNVILGGPDHE